MDAVNLGRVGCLIADKEGRGANMSVLQRYL